METEYERYKVLLEKNKGNLMPFVKLPINVTDKYVYWRSGIDRYDILSHKYYNNPFYDFLIVYANSDYLSEFDVPDGVMIRIPFPLSKAINDYEVIVSKYK